MKRFNPSLLTAIFTLLAVLFVSSPTYSQAPAYGACPPGEETQDDGCLIQPPDMLERHPPEIEIIEQIMEELRLAGRLVGTCTAGWNQPCEGNCGAGLVVEIAATRIPGARTLPKTWGAGCNSHSFDVLIFPDGYIYDVIGDAGGRNIPAWMPICCENLSPDDPTGDGTCPCRYNPSNTCGGGTPVPPSGGPSGPSGTPGPPGPCGPRDTARRDFVLTRLRNGENPVTICNAYNATFTSTPPNECLYYPGGPYIGLAEWYFARPVPDPDRTNPALWFDVLRVCDPALPFTTY